MILAQFLVKETFGISLNERFVQCGFPIDRKLINNEIDATLLELMDSKGNKVPAEFEYLHPVESTQMQWCRVSFICNSNGGITDEYSVCFDFKREVTKKPSAPVVPFDKKIEVSTNALDSRVLNLRCGKRVCRLQLSFTDTQNSKNYVRWQDIFPFSSGSLSDSVTAISAFNLSSKLEFRIEFLTVPMNESVRIRITAHNKKRAVHPDSFWDLGDPNSFHLKGINFEIETLEQINRPYTLRNLANVDSQESVGDFRLMQLASGGEVKNSRSHLNKAGDVATDTVGFESTSPGQTLKGNKFSPTLIGEGISFSFPEFWQRFPSGLSREGSVVNWHFLPEWKFDHEVQAGEKCCKEMWLFFGEKSSSIAPHFPLIVQPLIKRTSESVDWGVGASEMVAPAIDEYLSEMLSGGANFYEKRELIDEYGWRNFGDVWADHEEAFADCEKPVISHYNNQYDLLNGFLLAFLRTGDVRWWNLAEPLAIHVINIDLYDTFLDRAGFNQGLFWHTAHYQDAGTASHRSYALEMSKAERHTVSGGGPGSNEQAYSSGLRLYYQLTGDLRARRAVINLANWIVGMDDGSQSVLAPLCGLPTGRASSTTQANYHGPGRGAGNAINCLIDAWLLSNSKQFLNKAHEIILRVIHPHDDISSLDLLNAELRWSYTVFLQSLLKYLESTKEVEGNLQDYVKACLCTYGEWMLENESLYFDRVNELEFPTETWHAQDLRKANMLVGISHLHPNSELASKMIARGRQLRDDAWKRLFESETKLFSRPCALALQQVPIQLFVDSQSVGAYRSTVSATKFIWPEKNIFVDQKTFVKTGIKRPVALLSMATRSLWLPRWLPLLNELGIARRIKSKLGFR